MIEICREDVKEFEAEIAITAPMEAMERPGFIRILGIHGQDRKHRAYMLSQRALIDFEEGFLKVRKVLSGELIKVCHEGQEIRLEKGCVLAMDTNQKVLFFAHEDLPLKQMLSILNRAAARLIRLDVP